MTLAAAQYHSNSLLEYAVVDMQRTSGDTTQILAIHAPYHLVKLIAVTPKSNRKANLTAVLL